jgi:hypothetical protein
MSFSFSCVVRAMKQDRMQLWTISNMLRTRLVGKFQAVRSLPQDPGTVRMTAA